MPFARIDICFIVRHSDQDESVEESHRFLNQLILKGKPIFDSSVQVTLVSDVENADETLREFEPN